MTPDDLNYQNLTQQILLRHRFEGRTESASFLAWFLENIFRLDDVAATDAICDGPGDRGIDGIYVDHDSSEIIFLQAKVRQRDGRTIGDATIREFAGSITQFDSSDKIAAAIEANPASELANLLKRVEAAERLVDGYAVGRVFVTNSIADDGGRKAAEALAVHIYDRMAIADRFIEITAPEGIDGDARFDVSDSGYLEFNAGGDAKLYLITAKASDLLALNGLSDGTLFSQNVRLNLGSTKVNKDIRETLSDRRQHIFFPMYHNGITIICNSVDSSDPENLILSDYVVVNGAQSLSVLYNTREKITNDLRFIVKIIEIKDNNKLSRDITLFSNNQNAIKPRDLRSTHLLQTRLKEEFEKINFEGFRYLIKRGEDVDGYQISNEDAGRLLLAFDIKEPWSCHQIYKVFDEKYTEIFGRPAVSAWRIIFLKKIMDRIEASLDLIERESIQKYLLSRYFLLFSIAKILDHDVGARKAISHPNDLLQDAERCERVLDAIEGVCRRLCVDLRFELGEGDPPPDYKAVLKSPVRVQELEAKLRRSFEHDVARGREERIGAALCDAPNHVRQRL